MFEQLIYFDNFFLNFFVSTFCLHTPYFLCSLPSYHNYYFPMLLLILKVYLFCSHLNHSWLSEFILQLHYLHSWCFHFILERPLSYHIFLLYLTLFSIFLVIVFISTFLTQHLEFIILVWSIRLFSWVPHIFNWTSFTFLSWNVESVSATLKSVCSIHHDYLSCLPIHKFKFNLCSF